MGLLRKAQSCSVKNSVLCVMGVKVQTVRPCVNDTNLMSLHAQYATTMWDYINRAMPLNKEGTLKPDEVYALVAFLLFKNGVIPEDQVMDAQSLPKVKMPNRDHGALALEWKHGAPIVAGYP
jgi:cytochrome c